MWHCPSGTAIFGDVENAIQDLSPRVFPRPSSCFIRRQEWRNLRPFGIINIGRVGLV